jgi:hypothetical protein
MHEIETHDGSRNCWTDGNGAVAVVLPPGTRVVALLVEISGTGPTEPGLGIAVDGVLAWGGPVRGPGWLGPIALPPASGHVQIGLASDTFVPATLNPGTSDTRRLGVRLGRMVLMEEGALTAGDAGAVAGENPFAECRAGPCATRSAGVLQEPFRGRVSAGRRAAADAGASAARLARVITRAALARRFAGVERVRSMPPDTADRPGAREPDAPPR